jgi:endoglucanase
MNYVNIEDVANYLGEFIELKNDRYIAKAFDDRTGAYILIEAMKKIKNNSDDLYFSFVVQEELGLRGSRVAAARIKPDFGIAVDITPAHDYLGDLEGSNGLGLGTCIKISDSSVICDEELVSEMIKIYKDNNIMYQLDVMDRGDTDAGAINQSNEGVKGGGINIVTRFFHGPNSMIDMKDVNS